MDKCFSASAHAIELHYDSVIKEPELSKFSEQLGIIKGRNLNLMTLGRFSLTHLW